MSDIGIWMLIWKIVFFVGVGLFGGMAVWVIIGGLFDIKRLFARIREEHERESASEESSSNLP